MSAHVLLNQSLLNSLRKSDKMLGKPRRSTMFDSIYHNDIKLI